MGNPITIQNFYLWAIEWWLSPLSSHASNICILHSKDKYLDWIINGIILLEGATNFKSRF